MNRFLLILSFLFGSLQVKAQFSAGLRAGGLLSREHFSNKDYSSSSIQSYYAGLYAEQILTERISIRSEVNFSREGSREKSSAGSGHILRHYINIPVAAKFRIFENTNALMGPLAQFNFSASEKFNGQTKDVKDYTRPIVLSWLIGVGHQWNKLGIEIRYQRSFTGINKGSVDGGTIKGQSWSGGLSYQLLQ